MRQIWVRLVAQTICIKVEMSLMSCCMARTNQKLRTPRHNMHPHCSLRLVLLLQMTSAGMMRQCSSSQTRRLCPWSAPAPPLLTQMPCIPKRSQHQACHTLKWLQRRHSWHHAHTALTWSRAAWKAWKPLDQGAHPGSAE